MEVTGAVRHKGSGSGPGPARGVQGLPDDVLVAVLRRASRARVLGGPLHFALVCRRFAALRFRAADLHFLPDPPGEDPGTAIPGPLLASELQVYRGPTSLKLNSRSVRGLRALWLGLAVQGPVLTALDVSWQEDTCVACEGECPDSHRGQGGRDSQLCAHHGQASAWWAFSGPFLRAQPGLRSLSIQGSQHMQGSQLLCPRCCVGFTGANSLVSLPELQSSLSRLKHLNLRDVNLGWPQDWPSALPSLKSLSLGHDGISTPDSHRRAGCIFPWSILQMTSLTSLFLQLDMPSVFFQDYGRLTKLRRLSLALWAPIPSVNHDPVRTTPPASIWTLTGLRSLSLSYAGDIPESGLGRLTGLTELVLISSGLQTLPHSLQALQSVDVQSIYGLEGLQESFGRREALTFLALEDCFDVTRLADDFCQLESLTYVCLKDLSQMEVLPPNFSRLQSLQEIVLMQCDCLRRLPADFGLLPLLTKLELFSLNSLEELPGGFGRLQRLRILKVTGCRMLKRLPADFAQLPSLTDLTLKDLGALEELPELSTSLDQQRRLELAGLTSLRRSLVPGLVLDNMQEDVSYPEEDLPGLGDCAGLRELKIKGCGSLVVDPEHLLSLPRLKCLVLDHASQPGELDVELIRRIPYVNIVDEAGYLRVEDDMVKWGR